MVWFHQTMSETQHTIGPWVVEEDTNFSVEDTVNERRYGIYAPKDIGRGGSWVAAVEGDMFPDGEDLANANLMAAAPDLLEALKASRTFVAYAFDQGIHGAEEAGRQIDAGIAKAEGGA